MTRYCAGEGGSIGGDAATGGAAWIADGKDGMASVGKLWAAEAPSCSSPPKRDGSVITEGSGGSAFASLALRSIAFSASSILALDAVSGLSASALLKSARARPKSPLAA